jgi:preprotein translocase subunit SecD
MKSLSKCLFLCLLTCTSATTKAGGEDLVNCLWPNGKPIDPRVCTSLRKTVVEKAEQQAQWEAQRQADQAMIAKRQEEQAQLKAVADQKAMEDKKRWDEEQAAKKAELDKYLADQQRQEDREEARVRKIDEARRKACGDDYSNPRIGMTIQRAQQCVADFKLKGQINRADGVVSTYMAGHAYAHVMNGKIISWGK